MRLLFLLLLAGCASAPKEPPLARGELRELPASIAWKTKPEVRAALGPAASEVAFDNGYEVWLYHQQLKAKEQPPRRELVLLFDKAGTLAKSRVR